MAVKRGISDDEIEIIGVEFTVRLPNGDIEELEMFKSSIVLPRTRGGYGYQPRITFHTTRGDYTIEDYGRQAPW